MSELVLRRVQIDLDGPLVDIRCAGGVVREVAPARSRPGAPAGDVVVDGRGGALLPGLHEHHIHVPALAAALRSVKVGPPEVRTAAEFVEALHAADRARASGEWLRAVGYHDSVAGLLAREQIDAVVPHRPVRVQHRSGALWVLNTVAAVAVGLDTATEAGIERDAEGRATGRLYGLDRWLRDRLGPQLTPSLAPVGSALASLGVTGITEMTPFDRAADLELLGRAAREGSLPQRVVVTGSPELIGVPAPVGVELGPVKVVVADYDLPAPDDLAARFRAAHATGRAVAVHCVSSVALVLAVAAWDAAGVRAGDRIEHGAVVPAELVPEIARRGLHVVTQPNFIAERGDEYRREVEPGDVGALYRCGSLIAAGVPVGAGTDAPFGAPDPWAAMRAAVSRTTPEGALLGASERVSPLRALGLFLAPLARPGGPRRVVREGCAADLCLLAVPLRSALRDLDARHVVATFRAGRPIGPTCPR